ncbi:MAG TPA: AAA family ATPase, partial [Burkholderiales bacterium]|nr:AAA family ATPase [Burkholderiales bacterium]
AGTGKTTLALKIAATITQGARWPDGSRTSPGNALIWSGEDDPADTLIPRLKASGANLEKVYFVGDVFGLDGRRSFDPANDVPILAEKLEEIGGARLLIVDPIVSAVAADSHKNGEVRRALQPLADLGAGLRCAILGITHLTKGTAGREPLERITGSLAFGALARLVLVTAKDQESGDRLFLRAKSNIGIDSGGFKYFLEQTEAFPGIWASHAEFGEQVEGSAREILAQAEGGGEDGGELSDAKSFLASLLSDGPLLSRTIKIESDGAGYSWATIRRAQKQLDIEAYRDGGLGRSGAWFWRMPAPKMLTELLRCSQKNMSTLGEIEHLNDAESRNPEISTEIF